MLEDDEVIQVEVAIQEELSTYMTGFEDRLATAMQKALDVVTSGLDQRLQSLEMDQARVLRHLGLDK